MKKDKKFIHPSVLGQKIDLIPFDQQFVGQRYLSWVHDQEVTKYLIQPSKKLTLQDLQEYVEILKASPDDYFFAIVYQELNLHIGNLRVGPISWDNSDTRFGIMIGDKNFYGKGLATEALELTLKFVFTILKLKKFTLEVPSLNIAACKVYEKIGMKIIGNKKNGFIRDDITSDMLTLQISAKNILQN
jgi:ribosomal-protein-alanine N-acetyltransferase